MYETPSTTPRKSGGGSSFDILEIVLFGLGRFWYWIVVFALVGLASGLVASLKIPNTYASVGKFLVRLGARERQTPETVAGINPGQTSPPALRDEIQILRSATLFEQVAREVGPDLVLRNQRVDPRQFDTDRTSALTRRLHGLQAWLQGFRGPVQDEEILEEDGPAHYDPNSPKAIQAAAQVVQARTRIRGMGEGSQILVVQHTAPSPELAQFLCEKIMRMCQERHTQVFSGLLRTSNVDQKLERALGEAEQAEEKFQEHTGECGFYDLPKREEQVLESIREHGEALDANERRLREIERELATIEEQIAEVDPTVERLVVPDMVPNPEYESIRRRIEDHRKEVEELRIKFKEDSEHYQSRKATIDQLIAQFEEQLADKAQFVQRGDPHYETVVNPAYASLDTRRKELILERERLTVGGEVRRERLAEYQEELADIQECKPLHRLMNAEIGSTRSRAGQLAVARDNAERLLLLDADEESSNLIILEPASFIPRKVAPRRGQNLVTGLGAGAAIGAAFALLLQLLDGKLRFPRTARRMLGVRVLGVVPEERRWRRLGELVRGQSARA